MKQIPLVLKEKLTPLVRGKVDAMLEILKGGENNSISGATVRRWKAEFRKILGLPSRAPIDPNDPLIRRALEYVIARKERSDRCTLRSAKRLSVIVPPRRELISIEAFLKSLCLRRKAAGAASCHRAPKALCYKHRVIKQDPCSVDELPNEMTIARFLRQWRADHSD
jgi:hypothetical protein